MLVFMCDALHAEATAALREALADFAHRLCLSSWFSAPPEVGLCCVRRSWQTDVRLQMVHKVQPLSLRDWEAALRKLPVDDEAAARQPDSLKLNSALRALMSHLAKDQQRGTPKSIVIFAHGYQAVPQVLSTIQEASSHGIHITFQCLNPSPSQPRELHEAVGLAAFVSAVSPYENASYFEHQPDALDLERMLLHVLMQLRSSHCSPAARPAPVLTLCLGAAKFKCSLGSQIQSLEPHVRLQSSSSLSPQGLIRNEQHPAFCIGNQSMHLEPHTAMQVKQHMADVEDGREVIQVQRVVQAHEIDHALVYGWPHMLSVDDDDGMPDGAEGSAASLMAALCKALSQKGQLLLATSNMCISDTGEPRPLMWRQLFLLIPSGDAPAFLLRHLACREQLLPPTQAPSPTPASSETQQQSLAAANALLQSLPGAHDTAAGTAGGSVPAAAEGSAIESGLLTGIQRPQFSFSPMNLSCGCGSALSSLARASTKAQAHAPAVSHPTRSAVPNLQTPQQQQQAGTAGTAVRSASPYMRTPLSIEARPLGSTVPAITALHTSNTKGVQPSSEGGGQAAGNRVSVLGAGEVVGMAGSGRGSGGRRKQAGQGGKGRGQQAGGHKAPLNLQPKK